MAMAGGVGAALDMTPEIIEISSNLRAEMEGKINR